jgi:hypothetical protein
MSMKTLPVTICLSAFLSCTYTAISVNNDTLYISSKDIITYLLREDTHRYLVYYKMSKASVRSQTKFWLGNIKRFDYNGTPEILITQEWEDNYSIMHILKLISDTKTLQPLYNKTWGKVQASRMAAVKTVNMTIVNFLSKTIDYNGSLLIESDAAKQALRIWAGYKSSLDKYYLDWHLVLEAFPLLPYKNGVTFVIPFYDPGKTSEFRNVA